MLDNSVIDKIEQIINYTFNDKSLLDTAFTHTSFANENTAFSNERQEFLGDSILNFVITELLYNSSEANEGELSLLRSKMVSREPLGKIIDKLELLIFYKLGEGAVKENNISIKFKSNLFEAIVAAIYLDSDMIEAKKFILNFLPINITKKMKDSKSLVQEYCQKEKIKWTYENSKASDGFISNLKFAEFTFDGVGKKISEAEQDAAQKACKKLSINK